MGLAPVVVAESKGSRAVAPSLDAAMRPAIFPTG
jgi:hypothetical protein